MKKFLCVFLVVLMCLVSAPVGGFDLTAEAADYKVGDIIQFGSYPQSEVKDEALIAELNALAPEWDDWTSYGYYSGAKYYGTMVQGDWMRYIDVMYNGNKYRGIKFTQYRPNATYGSCESLSSTYQDNNGYNSNIVYWFKFDSIAWRVLDPKLGFVMCETIIDAQPYSNTLYHNSDESDYIYAYFNDSSYKNFATDYETSSIRKWLNEDFYNIAFTDKEKIKISTTTLNNDCYYSLLGMTGFEKLNSNKTKDKIFLLSYDEVKNSKYGFASDSSNCDIFRRAKGSDYAKSQGLWVYEKTGNEYTGNSLWLLRTPGCSSLDSRHIDQQGSCEDNQVLASTIYRGIRPAMCFIDIENYNHKHAYTSEITTEPTHTTVGVKTFTCECGDTYTEEIAKTEGHNYEKSVTEPTCTAKGYTTYTCACGDTYIDNYTDKLEHSYTSTVTTDPTHLAEGVRTYTCECGESYTESIPKLTKHTYVGTVTAPTCTTQGYTTYTCECGDSYIADYVDEYGHSFTNYISDGRATCSTNGLEIAKCDNCDETDSKVISGDHSFSAEWTIDEDPTCKYEGLKSRHCEFCPARTDFAPIGKLTHDFVSVRVEPSCLDEGYIMSLCYNCGEEKTETIEPTGHDFDGSKCTVCDFDKADDCNCNCHKNGILGLFWKIINFFNKLFKSKQYCSCGAKHW